MNLPQNTSSLRTACYQQLHRRFPRHGFDNWLVWAGNHRITIDDVAYPATLARAFIGPEHPTCRAQVRAELFIAAVDLRALRQGDVDARLWTDANARGFLDAEGVYHDDPGHYLPMQLVCDEEGIPCLEGNNLVFRSPVFILDTTGVFSYSVDLSADHQAVPGQREWISLSEIADNRNGVITVGPTWVEACPMVAEVCVRKVGARKTAAGFHSGRFAAVTAALDHIPADVIYLLPFYQPGYTDSHTGKDVRKGDLGSPYAVRDFFAVDPALVTPPEEVDLAALVASGCLTDADAAQVGLDSAAAFAAPAAEAALEAVEREALIQLIGRAELRALTRRAHVLGKRVIFDLVLMQTSRDCPLIDTHRDWYVLDEDGQPRIHQIAWLVYSDVALFDLVFNWPLQNYLAGVAPYWMEMCDLDGVRIDASQTVDRPFLKKIKNRINGVKADALILGETLCPLADASDIPVDMIYALMVDFHRDVETATPLIDFLEEMHARLAPRTVAKAYFENHDSPRATRVWYDRYAELLATDEHMRAWWQPYGTALHLALLKNLQASLIDLSAGFHRGSNLACGLEWGSWWGELERTDFENSTVLEPDTSQHPPHDKLATAYERLRTLTPGWHEVRTGHVYYHRHDHPGGDADDRVFAYVRYTADSALLFLHNLDPAKRRWVSLDLSYFSSTALRVEPQFDTYAVLLTDTMPPAGSLPRPEMIAAPLQRWQLLPLQSRVIRLLPAVPGGAGTPAPVLARAEGDG